VHTTALLPPFHVRRVFPRLVEREEKVEKFVTIYKEGKKKKIQSH